VNESRSSKAFAARAARRARYEALFTPWALAAAGILVSLAYLFQSSLPVRAIMLAVFLAVAALSGKRVSPLATILVSAGIVAANLLVPIGKVIWKIGPFPVTEIALLEGLGKALTFEGLVYISKACILPSLRLPGRFGGIIAAAFVYYDRIIEYKGSIRPASLIRDADDLMLKVWEAPMGDGTSGAGSAAHGPSSRSGSKAGAAILVVVVLAAWAALLLPQG
jgi:hypothetical protein